MESVAALWIYKVLSQFSEIYAKYLGEQSHDTYNVF